MNISGSPFDLPWVGFDGLAQVVASSGYAAVRVEEFSSAMGTPPEAFMELNPFWDHLPPDMYLRDGGQYRKRRHSCFQVNGSKAELVPHRTHWQPVAYNALHGGIERWFEPLQDTLINQPVWSKLLVALCGVCDLLKGSQTWFVEAHQFRIDTAQGIGRPTPEGAHRDGVDFVAIFLVSRFHIKGGETRVFEAQGPHGIRFTLSEPWTLLMLDDERVIHETTPIQPSGSGGYRDTLVLTFRRHAFQGPEVTPTKGSA